MVHIQAGDHLQLPPTIKSLNHRGDVKPSTPKSNDLKSKLNESAKEKRDKKIDSNNTSIPPLSELAITSPKLKPSSTLELTLFERLLTLHGPSIRRMLSVQYRMSSKIMEFPSKSLYHEELVADESVKSRVLSDLEGVDEDEDIDAPVVFIDSK